jgi:hypothetical protein
LGKYATVFQTEIYAILQCAYENIRAYRNKRILIFSDSQAALKALSGPKVTSRLDALTALADLSKVTLLWVPGHQSIRGNEQADKLAKQASATSTLGPEPALGIPKCIARDAIKKWTEHQHLRTWKDKRSCRHSKLLISRLCKKRAYCLLKLNRHQIKLAAALLTGHAPVRGHLRTIGLFNGDPFCRFCRMETETAQHIICGCDALSRQRYVFGKPLVEEK